ncbi:alpha/beta-hydrolase [Marasmius fiardii PR-910]|nr:alpha/beta-hydrolase [Marasmius fiardii PR-910]
MYPITSKTVTSSDGGSIYAEATGDPSKPALILIPGWTLPGFVFDKQFGDTELRKELYLIRYDPRGHGQSVMPETEEGHASKLYAHDFAAVCKAFGVVKPVVAGWSLAGAIISDICEHLGHETISGVIYLGSVVHLGQEHFSQVVPPTLLESAGGLMVTDDVIAHKTSLIAFAKSLFFLPESIPIQTRCAWMGASLLQPPIVAKLVLFRKQDPTKLFEAGKAGMPVLFIQGKHDRHRKSSTIVVEAVGDYFSQKEVVVLEETGHAFFYEKPEETNKLLLDFTRRVGTASS